MSDHKERGKIQITKSFHLFFPVDNVWTEGVEGVELGKVCTFIRFGYQMKHLIYLMLR